MDRNCNVNNFPMYVSCMRHKALQIAPQFGRRYLRLFPGIVGAALRGFLCCNGHCSLSNELFIFSFLAERMLMGFLIAGVLRDTLFSSRFH